MPNFTIIVPAQPMLMVPFLVMNTMSNVALDPTPHHHTAMSPNPVPKHGRDIPGMGGLARPIILSDMDRP